MRRTLAPWIALSALLLVAGIVLYAVADGKTEAVGIGCIGLATVLLISCVFYAVGISEERDRLR